MVPLLANCVWRLIKVFGVVQILTIRRVHWIECGCVCLRSSETVHVVTIDAHW